MKSTKCGRGPSKESKGIPTLKIRDRRKRPRQEEEKQRTPWETKQEKIHSSKSKGKERSTGTRMKRSVVNGRVSRISGLALVHLHINRCL